MSEYNIEINFSGKSLWDEFKRYSWHVSISGEMKHSYYSKSQRKHVIYTDSGIIWSCKGKCISLKAAQRKAKRAATKHYKAQDASFSFSPDPEIMSKIMERDYGLEPACTQ